MFWEGKVDGDKLSLKWTGPHTIKKRLTANNYVLTKADGTDQKVNVTRLWPYYGLTDKMRKRLLIDTLPMEKKSSTTDGLYHNPDRGARTGDMIIFPLPQVGPDMAHFGVGYIRRTKKINTKIESENDTFSVRWFGNNDNIAQGAYRLGWLDKTRSRYYATEREEKTDVPYLARDSDVEVKRSDLILWGFKIRSDDSLPWSVLRSISESSRIQWCIPPEGDYTVYPEDEKFYPRL